MLAFHGRSFARVTLKAEYLNQFVIATTNTFQTMLGINAQHGQLALKKDNTTNTDITAVIGMSGSLRGSIVMAFSNEVAQKVIGKFLGMEGELSPAEISDGIGELCNIVGGSAKVELNKLNMDLSISIPNVICGKGLTIFNNPQYPTLHVPFTSDLGEFAIEVCLMK